MSKSGPRSDITVLDLSRGLAGPYVTMVLADLGARVIEVERPDVGDDSRAFGPFLGRASAYFMAFNRGRESIALDLKSPQNRQVFEQLLSKADLLVGNCRLGVMNRLSYGWETLHGRNPRLIYAAISVVGQTGPYRDYAASVPTLNEMSHSLIGKATIGVECLLGRSGPMAMAPSQLGIFGRSDALRDAPNLEVHVQPPSLDRFGEPLHPFLAFTAATCNLRPRSRGSVHAVSPDRAVAPAVDPNYLSDEDVQRVTIDSIRLTRTIAGQAPLARYSPREFLPEGELTSDEDLACPAGDMGTTIFHPVGTARRNAMLWPSSMSAFACTASAGSGSWTPA